MHPLAVLTLAAPALLALLEMGCGGASVPHPAYAPQATSALVAISHEPPPARVETIPARPRPKATEGARTAAATEPLLWVDGEWSWKRKRWVWSPGRWVSPPAGATYSPWVTVRAPDGSLYFAPARWQDAKGKQIETPKALATATVESGAVVDAEGEMERTILTGDD